MFVTRGESEFEVSISMADGEWEGKIVENNLSHVVPSCTSVTTGPPVTPLSLACGVAGSVSFRMNLTRTGPIFRKPLSSPCRPRMRAMTFEKERAYTPS